MGPRYFGYFSWVDPPTLERDENVYPELLKMLRRMEVEELSMGKKIKLLWSVIIILLLVCIIEGILVFILSKGKKLTNKPMSEKLKPIREAHGEQRKEKDINTLPTNFPNLQSVCAICSSPSHIIYDCPSASLFLEFVQEQVNSAQGFHRQSDPYSNTYNPSNFSWRQQGREDSHTQSIANLETQIGPLTNAISRRDEDKLPSHPIENPRANYHEQAKAVITFRNGKLVDNKVREPIKDIKGKKLTNKPMSEKLKPIREAHGEQKKRERWPNVVIRKPKKKKEKESGDQGEKGKRN
ncbi:hypothetical protein M9H77_05145 [Catharanthus roseus]|uniref:Uncharacterized protein n=1 Tax=Catharanthus roseus TaxID=4058 RepID=A0ACC0CG24_CATRO|nr:hypothetical protein M9H77_05145 [Catharanthus roseus]